jgi:hypothetical protein
MPVPPLPHYGGRAPVPVPSPEEATPYRQAHAPRYEADTAPRLEVPYAPEYETPAASYDAWSDERRWDDHQDLGHQYDEYDEYDEYDDDLPARTNRMAIWGFVLAFVVGPVGLIVSAIGLSQVGKRHERGRGLAIAGVILSVVWLAGGVLFAVAVGKDVADQVASTLAASDDALAQAAVGTAPTAPPPTTVLQACTTLMPILVGAEKRMTDAATATDGVEVIADMRAAVEWAGVTQDHAFQGHLRTLGGDLQNLIDATRTGDVPEGLVSTLTDDSFVVGKDCGLSGWTQ